MMESIESVMKMCIGWRIVLVFILLPACSAWAADADHHPHHVALAGGISWHDSKNSVCLGGDYVYSWENGWGVGGF